MSKSPYDPSRRGFIRKSTAGILGFTILPAYLTSARAADNPKLPPSRRINLACIGIGGRARQVIPGLCQRGGALPVAFADVDFQSSADGLTSIRKLNPDVKPYHDFRKMLDEMGGDIDAVSIVTPDHSHFVQTILAMSMGKHVYTEKPLAHTFAETEMLMRAEQKFKVVTQMGNQGHTSAGAAQFRKMVGNGVLRDIVRIEAWKSSSLWFMEGQKRISAYPAGETIPESLKTWDLWCGPREQHPFSAKYHPFDWRAFYTYGGGMLSDWGAHLIDFAHDYLDLGLPTRVEALSLIDHNPVIYPQSSHLSFHFPARGPGFPAVELDWRSGDDFPPPEADPKYGDKNPGGDLKLPRIAGAGTFLHRKQGDYLVARGSHASASRVFPRREMIALGNKVKAPNPKIDHFRSFIGACMGDGKTHSPFSRGGLLTQTLNLGSIAERLNAKLTFDPATKRFTNNDQANLLLDGPEPRTEWKGFYEIV